MSDGHSRQVPHQFLRNSTILPCNLAPHKDCSCPNAPPHSWPPQTKTQTSSDPPFRNISVSSSLCLAAWPHRLITLAKWPQCLCSVQHPKPPPVATIAAVGPPPLLQIPCPRVRAREGKGVPLTPSLRFPPLLPLPLRHAVHCSAAHPRCPPQMP
eukprot:EG_transcript_35626